MADKDSSIRQNNTVQNKQAVHKPCTAGTPSQSHDVTRTGMVESSVGHIYLALTHEHRRKVTNFITTSPIQTKNGRMLYEQITENK